MRKKIIIISFLICKYLTTKRYNHLLYEYIIWLINPILLGDALSWYILIIRDFGPALRRSVNFDLFLMLFITDNLGGGIHSSYLVAWGISSVLFHFLPPLKHRETLRFHLKLFFTHRQTWLTTLQKALKVQTVGGPSVKSAMIALRYAATPQLSSNPCRARLKRVKSYVIGERERERYFQTDCYLYQYYQIGWVWHDNCRGTISHLREV